MKPLLLDTVFVAPKVQPDYEKEVLEPLHKAQAEAAAAAEAARIAAEQKAEEERVRALEASRQAYMSFNVALGGTLISGSFGYANPWGNCVNEPGVNNPHNGTNPISWAVTSQEPWIGASILFYFNHVAVVTGIWSNGDIEVRHQNVTGGQTRYPRSMIRGFR